MNRSTRSTGHWRGGSQVQQPPVIQQQQEQQQQHQQQVPVYPKNETMDYYSTSEPPQQPLAMDTTTDNGQPAEEKKFPPWKKVMKTADGRIIKKKKDPNAINLRLKKYVQPKNAAMCLNELKKVTYVTETEGPGQPTCVVVEVDGQEFRGYGSSKQLAKQAAAEAALVSFVKAPSTAGSTIKNEDDGATTGEETEKDSTPWCVLASFAMYKLFNDWRDGRVGVCGGSMPFYGGGGMPGNMAQALQQLLTGSQTGATPATLDSASTAISAYLKKGASEGAGVSRAMSKRLMFPGGPEIVPKSEVPVRIPQPAKVLPTNAIAMHPVMLLHQMRPTITFEQSQEPTPTPAIPKSYTLSANIDGKSYCGEGSNLKRAKLALALKANEELFGIVSTWAAPEKPVVVASSN